MLETNMGAVQEVDDRLFVALGRAARHFGATYRKNFSSGCSKRL
jgi:hypothetical protein